MKPKTIRVAPPHSFVWISDADGALLPDFPRFDAPPPVLADQSSVAIFTQLDQDGETEITIGRTDDIRSNVPSPIYTGALLTPNRTAVVWTTEWKSLLTAEVADDRAQLTIWTNRPEFPNQIIIGLDNATGWGGGDEE